MTGIGATSAVPAAEPGRGDGSDLADTAAGIGRSRWWWVGYGVLTIIAGLAALVWPGATLVALAVIFAVQLLVLGIVRIVTAFATPDTGSGTRVLALLLGIAAIVVGVLCLRAPLQTIVVLTLMLGLFWLVAGIVGVVAGIAGRGEGGRMWTIVSGLVGVLGGVLVLSLPTASAVGLTWVLGFVLVAHGALAIVGSRQAVR